MAGGRCLGDAELFARGALAFERGQPSRDSTATGPAFAIRTAELDGDRLFGLGGAFGKLESAIVSSELKLFDQRLDGFNRLRLFGLARRFDLAVERFALDDQFLVA